AVLRTGHTTCGQLRGELDVGHADAGECGQAAGALHDEEPRPQAPFRMASSAARPSGVVAAVDAGLACLRRENRQPLAVCRRLLRYQPSAEWVVPDPAADVSVALSRCADR